MLLALDLGEINRERERERVVTMMYKYPWWQPVTGLATAFELLGKLPHPIQVSQALSQFPRPQNYLVHTGWHLSSTL